MENRHQERMLLNVSWRTYHWHSDY